MMLRAKEFRVEHRPNANFPDITTIQVELSDGTALAVSRMNTDYEGMPAIELAGMLRALSNELYSKTR